MVYGFINNPTGLAIIALAMVLLFGGKNIPELMKGWGQGMREFKKGMESDETSPSTEEEERAARLHADIEQEVRIRLETERRLRKEKSGAQEGSP